VDGVARFTRAPAGVFNFQRRRGQTSVAISLQLAPEANPDQITGVISENGAPFSGIDAVRVFSPLTPGPYTFAFPSQVAPNHGLPSARFPQANGYGFGGIERRGGIAAIRAQLADFSSFRVRTPLTKGNRLPLYSALYRGQGSISGWVSYRTKELTDVDAADLSWFRPADPKASDYPEGWQNGIGVDIIGSKFSADRSLGFIPGLGIPDADGNAQMMLQFGGFSMRGTFDSFNITPDKRVIPVGMNPRRFRGIVGSHRGGFSGVFRHPVTQRDTYFRGVVLQRVEAAVGLFQGPTDGGAVILTPAEHPTQSP
jgi:hypothetical protein